MRRWIAVLLTLSMVLGMLSGCGSTASQKEEREMREFTDSCGRVVTLPVDIETIVPSGSLAQMILYTLCPDKLQSLSTALTRTQKQYIDEKYWDLPVTGQFYGSATISYEGIIAANPDVIIDIGEPMDSIQEDMDSIQQDTGIPTIYINASLDNMAEAYETLGELLGVEDTAQACADYIRATLEKSEQVIGALSEEDQLRVLYAQGEYGTEVMGQGSIHAQVIDYAGGYNVAELDAVASQGGNEVSIEQIMLWDPDVILLSSDANYDEIFSDSSWAGVRAVQEGRVYEVPNGPYNWMDRPPSVQRILAIRWLGNLLYPDLFDYDMVEEAQTFYKLFFHYDLTEAEAQELLQNSTLRE